MKIKKLKSLILLKLRSQLGGVKMKKIELQFKASQFQQGNSRNFCYMERRAVAGGGVGERVERRKGGR